MKLHKFLDFLLKLQVRTGAGWETMLHVVAAILRMPRDSRYPPRLLQC